MGQIETWLAAEDEVIAELQVTIEDTLAAFMDQAVTDFGVTGQFTPPGVSAASQMADVLMAGWTSSIELGIERQQDLLVKQGGLTFRAIAEYARTYGVRQTRQIVSTTASQLSNLVMQGQRRGLSQLEIGKLLINRVPKIARARAKIIAQTEVHSASQFGALNAALRSQQRLLKVWNTVGDERVRDFRSGARFSHRAMNLVAIPLDQGFKVPSIMGVPEVLMFPGDPNGAVGNIIQCRCPMTFQEV
jgi:hypothetical protein